MRSKLIGSTVGALAALLIGAGSPASAREGPGNAGLVPLLAPQAGNKACYARRYDAAYLRTHPRQRITAMTFLLNVEAYDEKEVKAERPEDKVYYVFAMSVARRGDKRLLHTSGNCYGSDEISCVVDCDGGHVGLDKVPPADTLIVRLNEDGVRMFHDCDDKEGVLVTSGTDDKTFRIDKAPANACRALQEMITGK
ncbi:MAG TPA: hypothetical protein VFC45_00670 [Pseudolabrys sp.]|nr:hypothetical protein [Pseudolabrys sp.]